LADANDDRLHGAWVREVQPAPDVGHLMAIVEVREGVDVAEVYGLLQAASGYLRQEVADAITRKRTPEIRFQVVPPIPRD